MQFLRKIDRPLWLEPYLNRKSWLGRKLLKSDLLRDLKTTENTLSVWLIDDLNLERVIPAVATCRNERVDDLEYVLFDSVWLDCKRLAYKQKVVDDCIDSEVAKSLHYDITGLSTEDVYRVLDYTVKLEKNLLLRDEVLKLISESEKNNWISLERIPSKQRKELSEWRDKVKQSTEF